MNTIPNLLDRFPNLIHFSVANDPNTLRYKVRGHKSLDGAFAGGTEMFIFERNKVFRSPSIRQKNLGLLDESRRGQTRAWFDLDDYQPLDPVNLPGDNEFAFLTIEEFNVAAAAYLAPTPIYVVPPAKFFGVRNSTITLYGTAPAGTNATAGALPPAGVLRIALPIYTSGMFLRNLGTVDLLFSLDEGMPMAPVPVPPGDSYFEIDTGAMDEIFLAANDAGTSAEFAFYFTLEKT